MANPNPSPETRFKPGNKMGGKTSEQKRLEYEAAEMAARLRHRMLSDITELLQGDDGEDGKKESSVALIKGDVLKLIKDSEDRAHGTPKSTNEHSGPDGAPIPVSAVEYVVHDPCRDED